MDLRCDSFEAIKVELTLKAGKFGHAKPTVVDTTGEVCVSEMMIAQTQRKHLPSKDQKIQEQRAINAPADDISLEENGIVDSKG